MNRSQQVHQWVKAHEDELNALASERERLATNESCSRYRQNRFGDDPAWVRMINFRGRFLSCLMRKWAKGKPPVREMVTCKRLFGCSWQEMRDHVESQFQPGMTWENHGKGPDKWCLDHKRPICLFDWWEWDGLKEAFHWTNVQPLWGWQHRAKTDYDNTLARKRAQEDSGLKERLKPKYPPPMEGTNEEIMAKLEAQLTQ